jgi:hypothetical protein
MDTHRTIILAAALAAFAAPAAAQECNCPQTFDFVTTTVRENYSGWRDKVTPQTQPALDSLTARVRARVQAARTDLECAQAMQEWIAFFRDGHVGVGYQPPAQESADQVRARFAASPAMDLDEARARAYLDANRGRLASVEGIWEGVGSPYRVAIVRSPENPAEFAAVVLRADSVWWMPRQVKATFAAADADAYTSRFYMRDHGEQRMDAHVNRNFLLFSGGFVWTRTYPAHADDVSPQAYTETLNTELRVRRLSDRTMLIQVPTMNHQYAAALDSLVRAHRAEILRTPNLIIDVRGNGGGSDFTYAPLLPLLYTDSIRSPGVSILSTPRNIRNFEEILEDTTFDEARKPGIRALVDALRAQPGQLVDRGGSVRGYDTVFPFPQRVAVLMNSGCASSCEQFVLAARDSRKATLFGTRTGGVLDYANVAQTGTTCPLMTVRWATSRSNRLPHDPVDPNGIAPQVAVPASEIFPVEWVQRWMESRDGGA